MPTSKDRARGRPVQAPIAQTSAVASDAVVGVRLRKARLERKLSLKAVEAATSGELGATALSGYERGEHAITVRRLYLLSTIYGVPVDDLIASSGAGPKQSEPPLNRANRPTPVRLDLDRLDQATGREAQMVRRLVGQIKGWRAPQARESIELRQGDLDTAAALLDESVENLVACLRDSGVLRKRRGRPPKGP